MSLLDDIKKLTSEELQALGNAIAGNAPASTKTTVPDSAPERAARHLVQSQSMDTTDVYAQMLNFATTGKLTEAETDALALANKEIAANKSAETTKQ